MIDMRKLLSTPTGTALLVALVSFLVYLKTLAPSVSFIDAGELAAVACTLGIAHPTGYPLFTLLGSVFSKLPIATEEIVRLNIMAAFFCAFGVFFFTLLVHNCITVVFGPDGRKLGYRSRESFKVGSLVASGGSGLLLAFSETYWSLAVAIEVYALHAFFLATVLYTFHRAVFHRELIGEDVGTSKGNVWWYLFAFSLGLSFTNHMTTILLAPGLLYLYFATQGWSKDSWKRIVMMVVPFLIGFSVYLYLPLRASQSPLLNWGNPVTLERFLWHWTGKQYRVWIFSSTETAGRQLKYFAETLPLEFAYVGLTLALFGHVAVWRAHRRLAVEILLLFFGCVFYSINYDIHDIDSYFLLAYVSVAVLGGAGALWVFRWMNDRFSARAAVVGTLFLCAIPCAVHYQQADETDNYLVEDYTKNVFASLQPNALVFSFQWDYWVSASYYYQHVKRLRPDVAVVDKELLRRSWYFKQLEQQYPWLIANSREQVAAFLRELEKFEHDRPYNPAVIQARFVEMIRSFMVNNMQSRPVYVTPEIEPEFTAGMQRVPEGLAYRLYDDTLRHEMRSVEFAYRPFERAGRLEDGLKNLYAAALTARGMYLMQEGSADLAITSFRKALVFNPNSREALALLRQVEEFRR